MPMFIRKIAENASPRWMLAFVLAILAPIGASATTPEELVKLPTPEHCVRELTSLGTMFRRIDQGMSRDEAIQLATQTGGNPISVRAVELAFDFPTVPRDGLALYVS